MPVIFLSVWRQKKRTKLSIYILDTIESESTTRFKNRSSDRMMTFDWLVDVSDDWCTTNLLDMTFWRDVFRVWLDISTYLYCMITYIFFSDRKPSLHSCKKSKKYLGTSITVSYDIPPAPHICPTYFHNQNITDCSNQKWKGPSTLHR